MHSYTWHSGLVVAAAAVACASGEPVAYGTTRADSAGIEIMTIRMPDNPGPVVWRADSIPQLQIGAAEGADHLLLTGVVGAVRLSDGRVVVANGGSSELRLFEPGGRVAGHIGGNGEGPGEFRVISFLGTVRGDTIVVYDSRLRRLSLFDHRGMFVSSQHVSNATLPYLVGANGQHQLGAWQFIGADDDRLGIYAAPIELGSIDLRLGTFRVIDTLAGSEESRVQYRGRVTRAFRPFGREGDVAAGGDLIYALASSDDSSIRQYDSRGQLRRIFRLEVPRTTVDAGAVQSWTASWMARFSPGAREIEEQWQHGFRETMPPPNVPIIRSLEVDADGNVCAERYPMTWTGASRYWCFSSDGRFLRAIHLPAGLMRRGPHPYFDSQLEIGSSHVLGVWQDSLDIEYVRLYEFR